MRRRLVIALGLVLAAGCGGPTPPREPPPGSLDVSVSVSGTAATSVVVRVTAPDLAQPLVFDLAITGGRASGTIEVPAGSRRTLVAHASDASGIETHRGSVTVDVRSGSNPSTVVTLAPVVASVPVAVSVRRFVVTVTPPSRTLAVGETAQVQASLTDAEGTAVQGSVTWASTNPSVASVDATGVVTARRAGTARIVAVYGAAASTATITVHAGQG